MNFIDLLEAKETYAKGGNVTEYLRAKFNESENTSEIIEIAYDLQAGSYTDAVNSSLEKAQSYASALAGILREHVSAETTLLDVGAGELTTLTLMLNEVNSPISEVLAFDISWSRLKKGMSFLEKNSKIPDLNIRTFVADIKHIPLHTKCVDVITSNHALEPNGKNLPSLLVELFRVAKKKLVLFEPSYELNSEEGRLRMERLGYIRGMERTVKESGGTVLDVIPLESVNPLNPSACYIIEPPLTKSIKEADKPVFCVPGTDYILEEHDMFFASSDTGLVFPVLDAIPVLRNQYGILATARFD